MKPQEVLKDPELKKRRWRSETAGELLFVQAGGSYSAHLNDAHQKLTRSLADSRDPPLSAKRVVMSAPGENFKGPIADDFCLF